MHTPLHLLLIEDSVDDADLLIRRLAQAGFDVESLRVETPETLENALKTRDWDVILGDYRMPQLSLEAAVAMVRAHQPQTPLIVVSGVIDDTVAARLMEQGVRDYFPKDNLVRLVPAIHRELAEKANRQERQALSRRLRYQAHHDPLTGLPDRALFNGRMVLSLKRAERHGTTRALFSIHMDYFRDIQDVLGHEAGDYFRQETARRLRNSLRSTDMLCRIGGDEFLVLSEVESVQQASLLAQRMLDVMRAPFRYSSRALQACAGIGVSLFPQHAMDAHTMMRQADAALDMVKQTGYHAFLIYDRSIRSEASNRRVLFNGLRRAAQGGELVPYFQPRYNPKTRQVVGMDTLMRWCIPGLDALSADEFIPQVRTQPDLIHLMDRLMWQSACRQRRLWQQSGYSDMSLGLYLSPGTAKQADVVDQVMQVVTNSNLKPEQLDLSIPVTDVLEDIEGMAPVLHRLSDRGVRLTLDNVGIEPLHRHELAEFPFHRLKIHPEITRQLPDHHSLSARTTHLIEQAHELGMKVCAKGVETDRQLLFLNGIRCDEVQGYLLGSPMSAWEAEQFLPDNRLNIAAA